MALGLISSGMARTGGREVALAIWFLAIYLVMVAAAPPLLAKHRRFGGRCCLGTPKTAKRQDSSTSVLIRT